MTSILAGLDFYKLTMSQFIFERHPNVDVVLKLHNRSTHKLIDYTLIAGLREKLNRIRQRGFTPIDLNILRGFKTDTGARRFSRSYINFLEATRLSEVDITVENGELSITTQGPWAIATLWETLIMSELNEHYYQNMRLTGSGDPTPIGRERLSEKISRLARNPDIKFADFGTRRRYSLDWHEHVIYQLAMTSPNFIGTSNAYFAHTFNVKPIGTFAHELPMVYAALANIDGSDPIKSQRTLLSDWYLRYGYELSVALTDTFTTEAFLWNFGAFNPSRYKGVRHDSGDPIAFGERMIEFYKKLHIDPATKTIVFSDGLDIDAIENIHDHFVGRIKMVFGWGTGLTNDMGVPANNFVVKVVEANGMPTVKLSDDPGKMTGPSYKVMEYTRLL